MKDTLGGKGSGLAEMTNAGLPVPPGSPSPPQACNLYYEQRRQADPGDRGRDRQRTSRSSRRAPRRKLGSTTNPLLVSVRSGAKFSMPGMMDTILNLGLNDQAVEGLKARTGNGRFAYDSYRRFIQMFGYVVLEIPKDAFEHEFEAVKTAVGAVVDTDLDEAALRRGRRALQGAWSRRRRRSRSRRIRTTSCAWPATPSSARGTTRAPRTTGASTTSPTRIGTAVNVQTMVFGNMGDRSATGVGFTRNPATGAKEFYGEFLVNAQGEDVVAGIRTPRPIGELEAVMPKAYAQLREITTRLEKHYKDIQDFEFTIQDDTLYMLQTRNGKRTGYAAVVIAIDLVEEGLITPKEALLRVEPEALRSCCTRLRPQGVEGHRRWPPRACRPRPARPAARWCSRPTTR